MWLFTKNAMLSIVEDPDDSRYLVPRARIAGDLESTFPGCLTDVSSGSDYRYRTWLRRQEVMNAVARAIHEIDYCNYKSAVLDPRRSGWYSSVWMAGADAQERRLKD